MFYLFNDAGIFLWNTRAYIECFFVYMLLDGLDMVEDENENKTCHKSHARHTKLYADVGSVAYMLLYNYTWLLMLLDVIKRNGKKIVLCITCYRPRIKEIATK